MYNLKKYKVARRLGAHLFEKTQGEKFGARAARYVGKAKKKPRSMTDYGLQMLEKQRVRMMYGIRERQFGNYVAKVIARRGSNQIEDLFTALETRLDNVVYRIGFAPTRQAARQYVSHGHIRVNNTRVTIPSFKVTVGDIITVRPGSQDSVPFASLAEKGKGFVSPTWLSVDHGKKEAKIEGIPRFDKGQVMLDLGQVLEFYKR
jgi:small subunit ribosomal protein S4